MSVTAAIRRSAMRSATRSDLRSSVRNRPSSKPASAKIASIASALPDTFDACFRTPALPGHQRRCGEPDHLPEGEVPRHHRQDRAERTVDRPRRRMRRRTGDVGQHCLGLVGIELADPCALLDLAQPTGEGFAHLGGHEQRQLLLPAAQHRRRRRSAPSPRSANDRFAHSA